MKYKLHQPYMRVRLDVIITIACTLIIVAFNGIINSIQPDKFVVFWVYVATKSKPKNFQLIEQFIYSFLIYASEVFLLYLTTEIINFKLYVYFLMVGREKLRMMNDVSIFLKILPDK